MHYCCDKLCVRHSYLNVIDMTSVLHWNYRGFKQFPREILETRRDTITDIYLKENSISEFPSDLCQFKCLKSLYLNGNDIKFLPKEIGLLVTLKSLDLSGNLLTFLPEEISQLQNLKCLILDDNVLVNLPLSLSKLRKIRYLSVCDNQLVWLPQRPVSNYYSAEFRFWRNKSLQHIPFSLWLHMLRDQQIKSQNIGCFDYPYTYKVSVKNRIRIVNNFIIPDTEIVMPRQYHEIQKYPVISPPSLVELCLRKCNKISSNCIADILNNNIYSGLSVDQMPSMTDEVGIYADENNNADLFSGVCLPAFLKEELSIGPTAICEFYTCKCPLFRSTILDITSRSTATMEGSVDFLVTANFCSGQCCSKWRKANRVSPFKWVQIKDDIENN